MTGGDVIAGLAFALPLTFAAATAALAVCAVTACLGPAWRASRIDPATTLRG